MQFQPAPIPRALMFPTPKPSLTPNTYAYESSPMVKPTGFREYDARWLLEKEINLMGVRSPRAIDRGSSRRRTRSWVTGY